MSCRSRSSSRAPATRRKAMVICSRRSTTAPKTGAILRYSTPQRWSVDRSPSPSCRTACRSASTAIGGRRRRFLLFLGPFEGKASDHGIVAETRTHAVDRMLGLGGAAVDEIRRIGMIRRGECGCADAEQAEFRPVGFAFEQRPRGGENLAGELRRRRERVRPGADAKVGGLELQRHGGAGQRLLL